VILFLDISPEDAAKRGGFGTEKYEVKKMQDRVRELFAELQDGLDKDDFLRIDAGKSLKEVEEEIWKAARGVLERVDAANEPLRVVESW
jgi:dTMP kinase